MRRRQQQNATLIDMQHALAAMYQRAIPVLRSPKPLSVELLISAANFIDFLQRLARVKFSRYKIR